MYAWIWRHLPGRPPVRAAVAAGLAALLAVMLWYLVFPWLEPQLQFDSGTIDHSSVTNGDGTSPAPKP